MVTRSSMWLLAVLACRPVADSPCADLDANGRDDVLFGAGAWTLDHPGGALYIEMSD